MRALLDANVLYPTVLREILADVAAVGLFTPLWSPRILDEWRHVAARHGPDAAAIAGAEIALLGERFRGALVPDQGDRTRGLDLPDPADAHVIEAALNGRAEVIVTANLRDFPRAAMSSVGLRAIHPDAFLTAIWVSDPGSVSAAVHAAHSKAVRLGGPTPLADLMKRARLPRLSQAIRRVKG